MHRAVLQHIDQGDTRIGLGWKQHGIQHVDNPIRCDQIGYRQGNIINQHHIPGNLDLEQSALSCRQESIHKIGGAISAGHDVVE